MSFFYILSTQKQNGEFFFFFSAFWTSAGPEDGTGWGDQHTSAVGIGWEYEGEEQQHQ